MVRTVPVRSTKIHPGILASGKPFASLALCSPLSAQAVDACLEKYEEHYLSKKWVEAATSASDLCDAPSGRSVLSTSH